ncbi:MAG: NADH-quinone oxidoreductase subunit C [Candidatus Thorarchaeota archaeon]|nr:MAG: NADH-quinone oxidoreductase subunit C [Candidatus Thorarchaeota archaeon]
MMHMSDTPGSASTFARAVINKHPAIESKPLDGNKVELIVPIEKIRDIVTMIDEEISDALPESMFGVDLTEDKYELIYIFWSHESKMLIQLRVHLEGEKPEIESVYDIFPGLDWHEREVCEMFGINIKNHPDLRLLLLPEELEGKFPMRKRFLTDRSRMEETGLASPNPRPAPGGDSS